MDRQEILHYLNRIREVWQMLFQGDKEAMGRLDRVTVKAVELTAPRASTQDAEALRRQLLSGEIFSAFSLQEREGIYSRLQAIDGLVPSFFSLFRDYHCLAAYANCVKWLTSPSSRNTVSQALESRFTAANLPADQAFVQEAELTFTSRPARWADQVDLGRRQFYAFSMRHYRAISSESDIYLSFFGEPRLIYAAEAVGNAILPQRLVCDGRPSPPLGLNQPVPLQRSPESREIATDAGDIASQIRDHTERESGAQAEQGDDEDEAIASREQERLIQNHIRQEMERCGQRENRRQEQGQEEGGSTPKCWV